MGKNSNLTKSERRLRKAKIISGTGLALAIGGAAIYLVNNVELAPEINDFPEIIENIVEKDVKSKDANVKNFNITGVEFSGDYADSGTVYGIVDYAETENSDIVIQYPAKLTYTDCDSTIRLKGDALNPLIDYDKINNVKKAIDSGTLSDVEITKNNETMHVLGSFGEREMGFGPSVGAAKQNLNLYGIYCGAPYVEGDQVCFEYISVVSNPQWEGSTYSGYDLIFKRTVKMENTFEDINDVFLQYSLMIEEDAHTATWRSTYSNWSINENDFSALRVNSVIGEEELQNEQYSVNEQELEF